MRAFEQISAIAAPAGTLSGVCSHGQIPSHGLKARGRRNVIAIRRVARTSQCSNGIGVFVEGVITFEQTSTTVEVPLTGHEYRVLLPSPSFLLQQSFFLGF
jgi:hypothetical protein